MTTSEGKGWTPGPWSIDGFNLGAVIVETSPKNWDKIAECGSHDDWRANARLISAAPDLHEALRRADHTLSVHGHIDSDTDLHNFIRAALAKAEGRK